MGSKLKMNFALALLVYINVSNAHLVLDEQDLRRPFDQELYRNVLDSEACQAQLRNITSGNPLLLMQFLDAGIRLPRGVLQQSLLDMGNYYQCLDIDESLHDDMRIQGKYCNIHVPTDQDIQFPGLPGGWLKGLEFQMDGAMQRELEIAHATVHQARAAHGLEDLRTGSIDLPPLVLRFAVCIPKPCTTQEALTGFNNSILNLRFEEQFCRLPDDKPWVAADTVAVVLFSLIGLLTLLSTCYDIHHTVLLKRDPKSANANCTSFSVYTNTRRLLTFNPSRGALECLDGIRVLAMMWVILGHTFLMHPFNSNMSDVAHFFFGSEGLWVTTAPITVDTFFFISGVLLVYTAIGQMNAKQLICNLHVFYLNRLLRLFPALAAVVLLEASVFHRIADGPHWSAVATNTQRCRSHWWATLLHVQNYVTPFAMCLSHSWYVAIDVQLYVVSPLVLVWVLGGSPRAAAIALIAALAAVLAASTTFLFVKELPSNLLSIRRYAEIVDYMKLFYYNTLTRAGPFFVGMIFGYILHLSRGSKIKINLVVVFLLWLGAFALIGLPFYTTYITIQPDWDNQIVDSLINSFQRSLWALALGWLVFACVHGYGGPINWFLSLPIWKLPSRLSYAIYLFHFPLMFIYGDMSLAPNYFTVPHTLYDFIAQVTLSLVVAFIVAVVIEAPFSTLVKRMFSRGKGKTKLKTEIENARQKNEVIP